MASLRVFLAALLLALPLWVALRTPAHACSCTAPTVQDWVDRVDVIVVGEVQNLSQSAMLNPDPDIDGPLYEMTIGVEEYLKGSGGPTLILVSGRATSCDVFGDVGDRFLLGLTRRDDGRYSSISCNAALITPETESDVAAFIGRIREVLLLATATSPSPPTATVGALPTAGAGAEGAGGPPAWLVAGAVGAGALLAGTALFGFRRRTASRF